MSVAVMFLMLITKASFAYRTRSPAVGRWVAVSACSASSSCRPAAHAPSTNRRWTRPHAVPLCRRLYATTFDGRNVDTPPTDPGRFDDNDDADVDEGDYDGDDDDVDEEDDEDGGDGAMATPKEGSLRLKVRQHVNPLASTYQKVHRPPCPPGFGRLFAHRPSPSPPRTTPAAAAVGSGLGAARLRRPHAAHRGRHRVRQGHLGPEKRPNHADEKRPRPRDPPPRGAVRLGAEETLGPEQRALLVCQRQRGFGPHFGGLGRCRVR